MRTTFISTIAAFIAASAPAADVAAFIELPYRYVIGGHADGKWLDTGKAGKGLKPGTAFRIFTLKGENGKLTVKKAAPEADVCMDVWMAEMDPEVDMRGIAVSAAWNPMPRVAKAAATTQEVYVKAVSDILVAQGIRKPVVKIKQHLRVDLDGDGEEEVLLSATHYPTTEGEGSAPTSAGAGNYSFVALRRVIAGKVVTQILEGEFYEKAQEFNAPNVHEVGGILDLNGDGRMELILHSQYYEGGATTVWQLGAKEAVRVLEIACGV
jgi:hypothetical protein